MKFWESQWNKGVKLEISSSKGLVRCEKDWCWDPDGFRDYDLWIVLNGSGEMWINGQSWKLRSGFGICIPPGPHQVHALHDPENPLQVFYCHFQIRGSGDAPSAFAYPLTPFSVVPDALLWGSVQEFSRIHGRASVLDELLLWQLLIRCETSQGDAVSSPDERVEQIAREIRESPGEACDTGTLASRAGMSCGHFRRIFRKVTGESPVNYVVSNRIRRACYYLSQTRLPVQQIALVLGYADIYYFSRQFKERTSLSPSQWRRESRAERSP